VFYDVAGPGVYDIACAHFTGSGRMAAFDYFDTELNTCVVFYVVDASPDRVYVGSTTDATLAMQWVNLGWAGSGARTLGLAFPQVPVTGGPLNGDLIVTA
jgi:hypothetical protein